MAGDLIEEVVLLELGDNLGQCQEITIVVQKCEIVFQGALCNQTVEERRYEFRPTSWLP